MAPLTQLQQPLTFSVLDPEVNQGHRCLGRAQHISWSQVPLTPPPLDLATPSMAFSFSVHNTSTVYAKSGKAALGSSEESFHATLKEWQTHGLLLVGCKRGWRLSQTWTGCHKSTDPLFQDVYSPLMVVRSPGVQKNSLLLHCQQRRPNTLWQPMLWRKPFGSVCSWLRLQGHSVVIK